MSWAAEAGDLDSILQAIYQENPAKAVESLDRNESEFTARQLGQIDAALDPILMSDTWIPLLQRLRERFPAYAPFYVRLAKAWYQSGNNEKAVQVLQDAVDRFEGNPDLIYHLSLLAYTKGQYQPVETWLRQLLSLQPGHRDGRFLLGSVLSKQGNIQEARTLLREVAADDPTHPLVCYELGLIENQLGNSRQAEEYLRLVVERQPFFAEAYNALLVALARQNKTGEIAALQSISNYLNQWQRPKLERMWYLYNHSDALSSDQAYELAFEFCKVHREDLAQSRIEQWMAEGRATPALQLLLAQIYHNKRDYAQCLRSLNQLPDSAMFDSDLLAVLKGWSLYHLGHYEESATVYEQGIERFPYSKGLRALAVALKTPPRGQEQSNPSLASSTDTVSKPAASEPSGPVGIERPPDGKASTPASILSAATHPVEWRFVDATAKAGLDTFKHILGHGDKRWIVDAMGSGVAAGDYDNDGDDDLYFVNGRPSLSQEDPAWRNALFENRNGRFFDVTETAGVGDLGFGMSAVFGDIDNDGRLDLFVGNVGANALYRNQGDGTFTNITEQAGVGDTGYVAAAAFADVDRDGDLDLFVGNYVDFDPRIHGPLRDRYEGMPVFTGPLAFPAQRDILYINDGTGCFSDGSDRLRLMSEPGRAMGAVFFDLENDGDLDLYVANDSTYNFVFENNGQGHFEDISFMSGGAFTQSGVEGASMGVTPVDYNNDTLIDLFITSYENQSDRLFQSDGHQHLVDETGQAGLAGSSFMLVTWGGMAADFDSDGWIDLCTANGHIYPQVKQLGRYKKYEQGVSLYRNVGSKFVDITNQVDLTGVPARAGRGAALLDYDLDGDMDIVINCIDGPPQLLENQTPQGAWLQVKLRGTSAQTYGVRVTARHNGNTWTRIVDGGSGYLSQSSATLHFGFGNLEQIDELTVYWHHAPPQTIVGPALNRYMAVEYPK